MEGKWEDSKFVEGRWILPNGNYYEGTFKNNKPDGKGNFSFFLKYYRNLVFQKWQCLSRNIYIIKRKKRRC